MLVSPPRDRPSASRSGLPTDLLSFDRAPCVDLGGRDHLSGDIGRWFTPGTGGVLVGADHRTLDVDRPVNALALIGVSAQLIEDAGIGAVC